MAEAVYADSSERLPWLSNPPATPKPGRRRQWALPVLSAAAGAAIVAGGWAWTEMQADGDRPLPPPAKTVPLPAPSNPVADLAEPQAPTISEKEALRPEAAPSADSPLRQPATRPKRERRGERARSGSADREATAVNSAPPPAAAAPSQKLWPARQVNGAAGRLVQIGAFGTRQQAKLGWRRMQRAYPAVGRLPAVVVEARNSKGRKFYRFQIGTTSHAHSEVLCQRMQRINFSCAVLGLPWKAKIER